jgi:TonB family protein
MKNRIAAALYLLPVLLLVSAPAPAQDAGDVNRKVVNRVIPQYPSLARSMSIQGNVKADVTVAPNGKVKSVEVKGGHPVLVQCAENALRQWKWEPLSHETHEIIELKFVP